MTKTISMKTTYTVIVDLDSTTIDIVVLLVSITFKKSYENAMSDLYIIAFSLVDRCTIEILNLSERILWKGNFWLGQFAH